MKFVKNLSGLFFCILLLFPLKHFWGEYFNLKGVLYDVFWIFVAIAFFSMYNVLFDMVKEWYLKHKK